MKGLLVISYRQTNILIAKAVAKKIKELNRRTYMAYGHTNQLILNELGIKVDKYYNGHIKNNQLKANKDKPDIVILNTEIDYNNYSIEETDLIIKGGNALVYKDGKYQSAVMVASKIAGTYGNIIVEASCIGAEVIIPISLTKLVSELLVGNYSQNSFDITMGIPITLLKFNYGEVFTEIEAFKSLYNLDAELYSKGYEDNLTNYMVFVVKGKEKNILEAKSFLESKINNSFKGFTL